MMTRCYFPIKGLAAKAYDYDTQIMVFPRREQPLFRVISLNTNGIRAAARKGFFEWMKKQKPDVVCIQETKAQIHQLTDDCFSPAGYHCYYEDAVKKGYSGVAIYAREKPSRVIRGFGVAEFDDEGRYLEARFGDINVVSVYLPSGSSGDVRQAAKYRFLDAFTPHLNKLQRRRSEYILCGDWNIAHKEIDLKNWRANRKNSGFLPEERQWMDELFGKHRYVDAFRAINQQEHQYTWWSNRGRAWDNNVGWRLDYQVVTPGLQGRILRTDIYKDERFSDHAPLIMDYEC
jgi:exodeoxyribonuclease-3